MSFITGFIFFLSWMGLLLLLLMVIWLASASWLKILGLVLIPFKTIVLVLALFAILHYVRPDFVSFSVGAGVALGLFSVLLVLFRHRFEKAFAKHQGD